MLVVRTMIPWDCSLKKKKNHILMNAKQNYNGGRCGAINYSWDCLGWANNFTVELFSYLKKLYIEKVFHHQHHCRDIAEGSSTSAIRLRKQEGQPLWEPASSPLYGRCRVYVHPACPNSHPEPAVILQRANQATTYVLRILVSIFWGILFYSFLLLYCLSLVLGSGYDWFHKMNWKVFLPLPFSRRVV